MNVLDHLLDRQISGGQQGLILPPASRREIAVIDVGSNSVRLVLYRVEGRSLTPVLNEKTLAGLGRDLSRSGCLSAPGVEAALGTLRRFRAVLQAHDVEVVHAVATAAVREASDGALFVSRVREETGLALRVLSGVEEARFAALGVLAGAPGAAGIVGDLGGSSLELVPVGDGVSGDGETLPVGPLALMGVGRNPLTDPVKLRAEIEERLRVSTVLPAPGQVFYAVGGAWRALAKFDMELMDYPLHVLQNYEIPAERVMERVEQILKPNRKISQLLQAIAGRRTETLPYAALALEGILRKGGFSRLSISAYGLREGVLFDGMSADDRRLDPLLSGVAAMAQSEPSALRFCQALEGWVAPALSLAPSAFGTGRDRVLTAAAAGLADLGSGLHPDHRGEIVFNLTLRGAFSGASHAERAFLALALLRRHQRAMGQAGPAARSLLDDAGAARAEALGAALRLGAELSGRSAAILGQCVLRAEADAILLVVPDTQRDLVSESIERRVAQLGEALGVTGRVLLQ